MAKAGHPNRHTRSFDLVIDQRKQRLLAQVFDAHNHAFVVLGGVPRRGIYDNMRTAVDRVRRGKERDVNARFATMVSHFLFEAEFCNPASGWEKGQVEKNVRDARHRLWQVVPPFPSLPDLNAWLEERCVALWHEIEHGKLPGTVADVWAQEKPALMPMPRPFDGFVEHTKRVSPTCLVHFERNRYSVPAPYANHPVFEKAQNLIYTQDWPPHHALADARALMAGYRAWRKFMERIRRIQ